MGESMSDRPKEKKKDAATGASAASARAFSARIIAFYFRAPAKAFFRTRIDYMAFVRAINPRIQANEAYSFHVSTPGLLAWAVRRHGWMFIPNQVLPPLLANVGVGAVLYTSYLSLLRQFHGTSYDTQKRLYPPPSVRNTFAAGYLSGFIQSLVAAPLDALQVRFRTRFLTEGQYRSMWDYGFRKAREIGIRGAYAGWTLSMLKDSFGFGIFFATFEYVKAQSFYGFVTRYYGGLRTESAFFQNLQRGPEGKDGRYTIRPHYSIEPSFLLLAGVSASVAQQVVYHPLWHVQEIHNQRFKNMDFQFQNCKTGTLSVYRQTYRKTFAECRERAATYGGWRSWLYRGFFWNTLRQIPSTSAGLIIFELVRRRYADASEAVRIRKDSYDILLT